MNDPRTLDNIDLIEQEHNNRRLRRANHKMRTTRLAMYLFAAYYAVSICRLFFIYEYPDPELSVLMLKQAFACGIYAALALLSYRKAFASFALATLLTLVAIVANCTLGRGIREQLTFLLAIILLFILSTALSSALNYDQLRDSLKAK